MKRMKKIMALMLAAIMMMAMSVTAFAAEGATKGTLTVNVKDGQTFANQTVNIYKLFAITCHIRNLSCNCISYSLSYVNCSRCNF